MKHLGNMRVTKENAASSPPVAEFYGHLTIAAGAHLVAPNLHLIRGWLTIEPGARLEAATLGEIKGWLIVGEGSVVDAPNLRSVECDAVIASNEFYGALVNVGSLRISANVQMDELALIRGGLTLTAGAVGKLRSLETVGGSITLKPGTHLAAPALKHIHGYYDADESAVFIAPAFIAS